MFYGFYQNIMPWAPGSFSYKGIASPTQRMGAESGVGCHEAAPSRLCPSSGRSAVSELPRASEEVAKKPARRPQSAASGEAGLSDERRPRNRRTMCGGRADAEEECEVCTQCYH